VSGLADRIVSELSDDALDQLAERLSSRLEAPAPPDAWLTTAEAAEYVRAPVSRIYSLVSARRVPFVKDGSRTLFRRSELDEWLRNGGGKRP
jgi:excisionase family DNA binding protein